MKQEDVQVSNLPNIHDMMNIGYVAYAGKPWQEAEQINQRRGGYGRGRVACTGHRLRHHAGPGCYPLT